MAKKKHNKSKYEEIVKKAAERDEYFNKFLKSCADFDNFRKRLERERSELIKFAAEDILLKVIPLIDNLDRAVYSLNQTKNPDSVIKGIQLIQGQFHDFLSMNGIKKIETKDRIFDPQLHEAVEIVEANDFPEHTILEEIQPGYTLNGKVIKHAFVKVSRQTEDREQKTEDREQKTEDREQKTEDREQKTEDK